MKYWNLCVVALVLTNPLVMAYQDRLALTLGPTLHYRFGKDKGNLTAGIEVSFWVEQDQFKDKDHGNFLDDLFPCPYGIDLGFEFNRKIVRIYTEPELGMFFY